MIEPFENKENIDLSNEYILEKQSGKYWKMIISFCIFFIIIIILGIFVIKLSIDEFNEHKIEINCLYEIDNTINEQLLFKEFENYSNSISMFINGELTEYKITQNFSKKGQYKVTYLVNEALKLENMFKNIGNLISIIVTSHKGYLNFSTSHAFSNCTKLESISLSINTKLINMSHMFSGCKNLKNITFNLGKNPENTNETRLTPKVKIMANMFSGCTSLTSLNLSLFNTNDTIDFSSMFDNCLLLKSLDLSNFYTNLTTNMTSMFSNCKNINYIDISNFNTSQVLNMSYMFYNCEKLQNLTYNNDTFKPNNASFDSMFDNCPVEKPYWYKDKCDSIIDFL